MSLYLLNRELFIKNVLIYTFPFFLFLIGFYLNNNSPNNSILDTSFNHSKDNNHSNLDKKENPSYLKKSKQINNVTNHDNIKTTNVHPSTNHLQHIDKKIKNDTLHNLLTPNYFEEKLKESNKTLIGHEILNYLYELNIPVRNESEHFESYEEELQSYQKPFIEENFENNFQLAINLIDHQDSYETTLHLIQKQTNENIQRSLATIYLQKYPQDTYSFIQEIGIELSNKLLPPHIVAEQNEESISLTEYTHPQGKE